MSDINYGTCDICGKESELIRVYERFGFPCICHSSQHFIMHNICTECEQTYQVDPEMICKAEISVDTFNTFLKAHVKYNMKYPHSFHPEDINPVYNTESDTPSINISCTYEMMCYLGKIYSEYIYEKELEEAANETDDN